MSGVDVNVVVKMFEYATGVIDGQIVAGKYIKLAAERFVSDLENDD